VNNVDVTHIAVFSALHVALLLLPAHNTDHHVEMQVDPSSNIVWVIISRITEAGHEACKSKVRHAHRIFVEEPQRKRPHGRTSY
jgi:hypothetical protein